jgi:two-component system NtrC family response regulator
MIYDHTLTVDQAEELLEAMKPTTRATPSIAKPEIFGVSQLNQAFVKTLEKIAAMDSHVLVQGEKGTGKMLVARTIHYQSRRADKPFLSVFCGEAPETLNVELFGVDQDDRPPKRGLLDMANGGTLYLDLVEACPAHTQRRLAGYLEDGYFTREGSPRPVFSDVRLVAATHGGLKQQVDEGRFRSELYYRLGAAVLQTPPLRDRREDIPALAAFFLQNRAERDGGSLLQVSKAAAELLYAYQWPDNVAQLAGMIDKAVGLCDGDEILPEHLPDLAA